jgi:hypothetical protein
MEQQPIQIMRVSLLQPSLEVINRDNDPLSNCQRLLMVAGSTPLLTTEQ